MVGGSVERMKEVRVHLLGEGGVQSLLPPSEQGLAADFTGMPHREEV